MPVLGLGWKKVVFGGMRSPRGGVGLDLGDGRRPDEHAGLRLARLDRLHARCPRRAGR